MTTISPSLDDGYAPRRAMNPFLKWGILGGSGIVAVCALWLIAIVASAKAEYDGLNRDAYKIEKGGAEMFGERIASGRRMAEAAFRNGTSGGVLLADLPKYEIFQHIGNYGYELDILYKATEINVGTARDSFQSVCAIKVEVANVSGDYRLLGTVNSRPYRCPHY